MCRRGSLVAALVIFWTASVFAATPPAQINYQGVLRDAGDKPLTGTYDIAFSFWDAVSGGNEILDDAHLVSGTGGVAVTNGLFNIALGSGTLTDGPGTGTYTSLDQVFRDYPAVWLQVQIGSETLSPRTQVIAAAYALNATNLNGQPSSGYVDTSSTSQTKTGSLSFDNSVSGSTTAVTGKGGNLGGSFSNYTGAGQVSLASGDDGIVTSGTRYGLYSVGGTSYGVYAYSSAAGGTYSQGATFGVEAVGDSLGLQGYGTGSNSTGVFGSGSIDGVYGSSPNYGVAGNGTGTSGVGVAGSGPTGVTGNGTGTNSTGVSGTGTTDGVSGSGPTGVYGVCPGTAPLA